MFTYVIRHPLFCYNASHQQQHQYHTPSTAFRHLPPWRKDVVNRCLECASVPERPALRYDGGAESQRERVKARAGLALINPGNFGYFTAVLHQPTLERKTKQKQTTPPKQQTKNQQCWLIFCSLPILQKEEEKKEEPPPPPQKKKKKNQEKKMNTSERGRERERERVVSWSGYLRAMSVCVLLSVTRDG